MSSTPSKDSNANFRSESSSSWSLEDIHQNAGNWSLEGDSKLLEFMQQISKNLENRCMATKVKMTQMSFDLSKTNLRLENTTNKMLSLKNLQFMEARVHDETEGTVNTANSILANVSLESHNISKNEPTTIEAVRSAVGHGLNMINDCYEKVTLKLDEDSDDDEELQQQSTVFRAKNPHTDRLLPHLIGSKEWMQKWHVGLIESDDEVSNGEDKAPEEFSESSTDDDTISRSVSLPSNTVSESDYSFSPLYQKSSNPTEIISGRDEGLLNGNIGVNPPLRYRSNIFDKSEDDSEENVKPIAQPQDTKTEADPSVSYFHQPQPKRVVNAIPLFSDEPPAMEISKTQIRKPLNLFMDTDDDEEISETRIKNHQNRPAESKAQNPTVTTTSNIFENDTDSEDNAGFLKTKTINPAPFSVKSNVLNLFDDSPPDDLFDVLISKRPLVPKAKVNIFDDDDLFAPLPTPANSHNEVQNTTQHIVTGNLPKPKESLVNKTTVTLSTNISDDDEDDMFAPDSKEITILESNSSNQLSVDNKKDTFDDIFGDVQPPEDDFADIFGYSNSKSNPRTDTVNNNSNLFESRLKREPVRNLFGDLSDGEGDIFPLPNKSSVVVETNQNHLDITSIDNKTSNDIFEFISSTEVTREQKQETNSNIHYPTETNDASTKFVHRPDKICEEKSINSPIIQVEKNGKLSLNTKQIPDENKPNLIVSKSNTDASTDINTKKTIKEKHLSKTDTDNKLVHGGLFHDLPPENASKPSGDQVKPSSIDWVQDSPSEDLQIESKSKHHIDKEIPHVDQTTTTKQTLTAIVGLFDDLPPDDDFLHAHDKHNISNVSDIFDGTPQDDDDFDAIQSFRTAIKTSASFGLFDDLPPEDINDISKDLSTEPPKETSAAPFVLFDDLPPDDVYDDPTVLSKNTSKSKSVAAFGLFDHLPPDDVDEFPTNLSTKADLSSVKTRIKTIFYEDFADTILPHIDNEKTNLHAQVSNKAPLNDETDRASSSNLQDKLITFTQPSTDWPRSVSVSDAPKLSKITENFKINVSALLPGAKRPSVKSSAMSSVEATNDVLNNVDDQNSLMSSSISSTTKSEQEDSSRLVGLNKGRAKIPVKRRPSTRKGRQEEYRKSLLSQTEEQHSSVKEISENKEHVSVALPTQSIEDMLTNYKHNDCPPETLPPSRKYNDKSTFLGDDDWFPGSVTSTTFQKMKPKIKPSKSAEAKHIPINPSNLFSEDDDDDLFAPVKTKPKLPEVVQKTVTTQPKVPLNSQIHSKREVGKEIKSNIFGDDDEDDMLAAKPKKRLSAKQSTSLFGDDDDDSDDDLFSSSTSKIKATVPVSKISSNSSTSKLSALEKDPLSDLL